MKNKIKYLISALAILLLCSWYDPILDLFTNASTATVDAANDWILFHDVTDGKKKKAHPSDLGISGGFASGPNTLTSTTSFNGAFAWRMGGTNPLTDFITIVTDTSKIAGLNSSIIQTSGFLQMWSNALKVYEVNNTDQTQIAQIPDNTIAAYTLKSADGNGLLTMTTTNGAPRVVLGSNEAGGAVGLSGVQYETAQHITSSGAFTATSSTIGILLGATGTVNCTVTGYPTSTTVASTFLFINKAALASGVVVTVDVTGATWYSGSSPILTEGQSVQAKLINGVLYPY